MVLVYFWRSYYACIWLHNGLWVKVRILSARFMAKPKKKLHIWGYFTTGHSTDAGGQFFFLIRS